MRARPVPQAIPARFAATIQELRQRRRHENDGLALFLSNADFGQIVDLQRSDPPSFATDFPGKRCTYVDRGGAGYEFLFGHGFWNVVSIDLNRSQVCKIRRDDRGVIGFTKEHFWLRRLAGAGVAPDLLDDDIERVVTDYLGEPVSIYNFPLDWRIQAERLLAGLASRGCSHNDIKPSNIVVGKKRLYVIDYEWSHELGTPFPERDLTFLNPVDDRTALFGAMEHIERTAIQARTSPGGNLPAPPATQEPPRQ